MAEIVQSRILWNSEFYGILEFPTFTLEYTVWTERGFCTEVYSPADTLVIKFMDLVDIAVDEKLLNGNFNNNNNLQSETTNFSQQTRTDLTPSEQQPAAQQASKPAFRKVSTFIHGSSSCLSTWDKIGIIGAAILTDYSTLKDSRMS